MVGVLYVANLIVKQQNQIFEPEGLNAQKFNALRILRGQYPNPASEKLIREKLIDKTIDLPRMLHGLASTGFVDRIRNTRDKRVVDVIITAKGLKTLSSLDKVQNEITRSTKLLSEEDAKQLNEHLEKMLSALVK